MSNDVYHRVASVLNTLPNGFPATDSGVEIKLLQKIFTEEEAELFCDLKLTSEAPIQIAERTGRSLEGLDELLTHMWKEKGTVSGAELGPVRVFKMMPWIIGIWEMQVGKMDEEFAQLSEEYYEYFGPEFFSRGPALMRSITVGEDLVPTQQAMAYDKVSGIIETGQSFAVNNCVCKEEERLLNNGCDYPLEVCLSVAPIPGLFEKHPWGRPISKEQAYEVIAKAEDAGLVHLTSNIQNGHSFICNCCGCCCAVLKGINKLGLKDVVNSDYYSHIDDEECTQCGLCEDDVCQVDAIKEGDLTYQVDKELCIGCGVCLETCPVEAIALEPKSEQDRIPSPADDGDWMDKRGEQRGVDFSTYK
jgi:NAD-dependent dihydropyrimidine dehydrogenase PreA subunit